MSEQREDKKRDELLRWGLAAAELAFNGLVNRRGLIDGDTHDKCDTELWNLKVAMGSLRNAIAALPDTQLRLDEADEPLRELCFNYRNTSSLDAEAEFQKILAFCKGTPRSTRALLPPEPTEAIVKAMAECYDPTWGYPANCGVAEDWAVKSYKAMLGALSAIGTRT